MRKLRKFLRGLLRPVALVGTVGIVSLSMVGAQPAYAAETLTKFRDKRAFDSIIQANFKTVAPVASTAMKAAAFTPVGAGIRLAQLGMLAYSTQDIWMPWVSGTFGAGSGGKEQPVEPGTYTVREGLTTSNVRQGTNASGTQLATHQVQYDWQFAPNGVTSSQTITYVATSSCQHNSTGAIIEHVVGDSTSATRFTGTKTRTQNVCPTGQTVLGTTIGPGGQYPGPTNWAHFGTKVPPSGFDPYSEDTKMKTRVECIRADGSKTTIEGQWSGDYALVPSCEASGNGHGTGKVSIVGTAPGTTTEQPVWDSPAAPDDPATPLCNASRASSGCEISIAIDGRTCTAGNVECENWVEVNQNDPNRDTDNARVRCNFGPYRLATSQCGMLEKAYVGGQIWSDENTDGDPATSGAPKTAPSGNPVAGPAPTTTVPGTVPGSPGAPSASEPDQQAAQCWPTGWGMLNPLEWVYKPTVCAAKAVFQPTKPIQTRVTSMQAAFANRVPMSWFGVGTEGVTGGACPTNWSITYKGTTHSLICGTPAEGIIRDFRPVLGAMLTIAMLWPLIRSLFYAAIPVFKVTPS